LIPFMLKNVLKVLAVFVIGMVGGIFADQIFWPYFIERPLFHQYRLEQTPINVIERKEIFIQENTALTEAVKKVEKAIVGVRTETGAPSGSAKILEGSGLVMASDGLIVTLAELVPAGSDFAFLIEGKPAGYQILNRDLKNNLALIKLDKVNLSAVSFVDLDKIKLGQRVFLVGTIFDKEGVSQKMVNEGIIKYFSRDLIHTNIFEKHTLAGSSLFDIEGNVLGLNKIDKEGKIITIPISLIREFTGL